MRTVRIDDLVDLNGAVGTVTFVGRSFVTVEGVYRDFIESDKPSGKHYRIELEKRNLVWVSEQQMWKEK